MRQNGLISGRNVVFRLHDAVCPDLVESLRAIGPKLRITGRVLFLSDDGGEKDRFAIVEVEGIHTPLIVPVERLGLQENESLRRPAEEDTTRHAC